MIQTHFSLLRAVALGGALVVALSGVASSDEQFTPVFKPTLEVRQAQGKISIDGRLDDAGWHGAAHVDRFHERHPGDNVKPEVPTEVLITYDDAKLYVGFVCHDDPRSLRATMSQRDQWSGDDAVVVFLDTYGDGAWAYQLYSNPYGVQKDMLWTAFGMQDLGFDVVWESSAR